MSTLPAFAPTADEPIIFEICNLNWTELSRSDMVAVAYAYYHFSVQFRRSLLLACEYFPDETNMTRLRSEECDTDNLSPYPGVALPGERMNHDTFMERSLQLTPLNEEDRQRFDIAARRYERAVMNVRPKDRALAIGSYERGGLERLFRAILTAPAYDDETLHAFRYFMEAHIQFDSDPLEGHGALSRHMMPDESVVPLWEALKDLLIGCAPNLSRLPALQQVA